MEIQTRYEGWQTRRCLNFDRVDACELTLGQQSLCSSESRRSELAPPKTESVFREEEKVELRPSLPTCP